ncbi:MAG TPA: zf-HC2 domain-containing protein [Firmicutes bacterium]|nr:zf-HC2 domain-containing protein [Bacillota bacterium]
MNVQHLDEELLDRFAFGEPGELDEVERLRVEEHLAKCSKCSEALELLVRSVRMVEYWGSVKAPESLITRVRMKLRHKTVAPLMPIVVIALGITDVARLWVLAWSLSGGLSTIVEALPRMLEALSYGWTGILRVVLEIVAGSWLRMGGISAQMGVLLTVGGLVLLMRRKEWAN